MQTSSELIQRTHDDPFRKISTNLLAYVLQFCGVEDLKNFSYLNSKFKKAFNKDLIWEIQVLGDYLFCTEEKRKFSSWRDYYLSLKKLKRNFQGGRSNKNFQMRPARGHKRIITALVCDENKSNGKEFIISGDEGGVVLQWSLNEDGEYFAQEILKTEGVVTDIV